MSTTTPTRRWRLATVGLTSAAIVAATTGGVSAATVPPGQSTSGGLLTPAASTFATPGSPWSSYSGGTASVVSSVGHTAAGALAVTSAGPWTGAASPAFAVTPGARYTASAWVLAKSAAHSVGVALQFRDGSGTLISSATQLGQNLTDSASGWSRTAPVIGFAPSGATSAIVIFVDYDGGAGDIQYVDDVSLTRTTGTAARVVGPLTTRGPRVLDARGRQVHFTGVDIDGLQYSNTANVTTSEVTVARSWGANFVRLPLAENYALAGDCSYDSTYLSKVDAMVNAATSAGMFIMLDLHTNALTPCAAPRQQLMPDAKSVTFWQTVAARYKSNPLVGFDLYNEPHDVSDGVWRTGGTVYSSGVSYSAPGMQQLYAAVRGTGAKNLVFASGTSWATTFPRLGGLIATTNLVYAAHAYSCPNGLPGPGVSCTTGPDGTIYDPSGMLSNFAAVGTIAPVMVTEFGFPNKNDGRYITNVISYATSHGWVGWDVYAFDGYTSGLFDLWKNTDGQVNPAISGMSVIAGMLGN